jgi:hypothetical protein
MARVTIKTTAWPKRTPEPRKTNGVRAARYSGLHFMIELRVVVGRLRNGKPVQRLEHLHVSEDHTLLADGPTPIEAAAG